MFKYIDVKWVEKINFKIKIKFKLKKYKGIVQIRINYKNKINSRW